MASDNGYFPDGSGHAAFTGTLTIRGVTARSGLNRARIYRLAGEGVLDARKAGRQTLITEKSLVAYLESLPAAQIRSPTKNEKR